MSNLETVSGLAGSAPSEQEVRWLVGYLDQSAQEYGVHVRNAESKQAAIRYASCRDALYWLRTALPGLLATARDGERKIHGVTWILLRDDLISGETKVLLERCPKKAAVLGVGEWFVPGGKIEGDETPEDALRREIGEEWPDVQLTGWMPLPIIEGSRIPPGPRGLFLMRPFLITASGNYPDRSGDGVDLRWFPISEALASPVPQVRMMIAAARSTGSVGRA